MDGKILYSKTFPRDGFVPKSVEHLPTEEIDRAWKRFLERIEPKETHTPIPGRREGSLRFMDEAIDMAESFRIDTEIVQKVDRIVVAVEMYMAGPATFLKELFRYADEVYVFRRKTPGKVRIEFDYRTHV